MTSIEIDLASGSLQLPDLFVRNESKNTITFSDGTTKWELEAVDTPNNVGTLPWPVATSAGFQRIWASGQVTVARDINFVNVITSLPSVESLTNPAVIFRQDNAQSVTDIEHGFQREGPVTITIVSTDMETEYYNFLTDFVDANTCRVTFDDPTSFIATVT